MMLRNAIGVCSLMILAGIARADSVVVGPVADPFKPGYNIEVISQDSWTGDEAYAQSIGGNLMSINSAAENTWAVTTLLIAHTGGPDLSDVPVWIGFSDANTSPTFEWADGSTVTYTNWNAATGEPNDDQLDELMARPDTEVIPM